MCHHAASIRNLNKGPIQHFAVAFGDEHRQDIKERNRRKSQVYIYIFLSQLKQTSGPTKVKMFVGTGDILRTMEDGQLKKCWKKVKNDDQSVIYKCQDKQKKGSKGAMILTTNNEVTQNNAR